MSFRTRRYAFVRVLLVEDNPSDASMIEMALRSAGRRFDLSVVSRLDAAQAHLVANTADVVLLDLNLPDSTGIATLDALQSVASEPPILVLTGVDDDALALEALHRGAADYLVKDNLDGALLGRSLIYAVERRRIEQQLAEAQRIAHVGSWEWNIPEDSVSCSRELLRIYGVNAGSAPTTFAELLAAVSSDDRERVREVFSRAQGNKLECVVEHRIDRPNGEVRMVLTTGHTSIDGSGRPIRMAGTAQDITAQKRLQEQLLISERMASIGTLAAGVGHEINNPFAIVTSNIDFVSAELAEAEAELRELTDAPLLRRGGRPQTLAAFCADLQLALDDARAAGQRVRQIVRDLKVFSRGDDEVQELVDVRAVIDSTVRMAMNEIRHRARLVKAFEDVAPVRANGGRLGQVILNLIVNAAHAIVEGDADHNEIRITTSGVEDRVIVTVTDTGVGIPPAALGRIFDPFFTTKPIGVGTGLGLAICHRIIANFGGEIAVTSDVGKGTTIRIQLPAAKTLSTPAVAPASRAETAAGAERRGRILVIDDEPAIGVSIKRILGRAHEVMSLTDAREAYDRIVAGARYDVILCDLMMPQWTGIDFFNELTASVPEQAENIVFLTGGAFTERGRAFLDEVPNFSLEKPFESKQLRALLHERLRRPEAPSVRLKQ